MRIPIETHSDSGRYQRVRVIYTTCRVNTPRVHIPNLVCPRVRNESLHLDEKTGWGFGFISVLAGLMRRRRSSPTGMNTLCGTANRLLLCVTLWAPRDFLWPNKRPSNLPTHRANIFSLRTPTHRYRSSLSTIYCLTSRFCSGHRQALTADGSLKKCHSRVKSLGQTNTHPPKRLLRASED